MLSQCLVPSIAKKVNFYTLVLRQHPLIAPQIQTFQPSISIYLKIILKSISIVMSKNTNKTKITETNFDLAIDS